MDAQQWSRTQRVDLPAGRVGRAHGLDGSFYVLEARARLLEVGRAVTVGELSTTIARLSGTAQRPIVRLDGVLGRDAARALHGLALTVEGQQAPALGEQEWWVEELVGCAVVGDGRALGAVIGLVELPSCEALEVRGEGGESLLVPMVKDAIRAVAIAERRIEVSPDFLGLTEQRDAPERAGKDERQADEDPA